MIKFRKILEKAGGAGGPAGHASLHAGIADRRPRAAEAPGRSAREQAQGRPQTPERAPARPAQAAGLAAQAQAGDVFADEALKGVLDELLAGAAEQSSAESAALLEPLTSGGPDATDAAAATPAENEPAADDIARAVEEALAQAQAAGGGSAESEDASDAQDGSIDATGSATGEAAGAQGPAGDIDGDFMAEVDRLLAQFGQVKAEEQEALAAGEQHPPEDALSWTDTPILQAEPEGEGAPGEWSPALEVRPAMEPGPGAAEAPAGESTGPAAGGSDKDLLDEAFASLDAAAAGGTGRQSQDEPAAEGEAAVRDLDALAGSLGEVGAQPPRAPDAGVTPESGPSITDEEREALLSDVADEGEAGPAEEPGAGETLDLAGAIERELDEALEAAPAETGPPEVEIDFTASAPAEAAAPEEGDQETLASTEDLLSRMLSDLDKLAAAQPPQPKDAAAPAGEGGKDALDDDIDLSALLSQGRLGIEEPEGGEAIPGAGDQGGGSDDDSPAAGASGADAASVEEGGSVTDILARIQASMSKAVEQAQKVAAEAAPKPPEPLLRDEDAIRQEVLSRSKDVEQKILDEAFGVDEETIRAEVKGSLAADGSAGRSAAPSGETAAAAPAPSAPVAPRVPLTRRLRMAVDRSVLWCAYQVNRPFDRWLNPARRRILTVVSLCFMTTSFMVLLAALVRRCLGE